MGRGSGHTAHLRLGVRHPPPAAVTHQHSAALSSQQLPAAVALAAAVATGIVALFHATRIVTGAGRAHHVPAFARRVLRGRSAAFVPVEIGHTIVAVGMAIMFVGPSGLASSGAFALTYLVLAGVFLVLVLTNPACCEPAQWSCCSMLVVEALAMACMAHAGRWPVGDLGDRGDLSGWFAVVFAVAAVAAVGGPLLRRAWPAWDAIPAPITPAASRLLMAGGMLLMLL
ncbi:DUF5134 domain-containing protein [Candidatus Frankia alpina]|uniref:DUF5134 domain-containing protein n=1 Tax=Candidatus Frankia alpina TaxID=2699483 RepID=A0A4S5E9G8_9ACTN|nr:DUF5134 domain-containing protein [Candidatus Frankia alpina]